jgi:membrane-associated phospholipid phosphatase
MMQPGLQRLWMAIRSYPVFFAGNALFLLVALVFRLQAEKGALVLYFSAHRGEFWTLFFKFGTLLGEAYVYIAATGILAFVAYRMALAVPLLGVGVTLASFILKKIFSQPRPPAYFTELGRFDELSLIAGVKVYMGYNSFPSGHTMSAYALFTFLLLALDRRAGSGIQLLFAGIVVTVGLSRVYLMHHFIEDVWLGAVTGMLMGWLWYDQVAPRLPVTGGWKK